MRGVCIIMTSALLVALCISGCKRENEEAPAPNNIDADQTSRLLEQTSILKERVEQLEVAQAKLVEKIDDISANSKIIPVADGSVDVGQIEAIIDTKVEQSVSNVGQNRLAEIAQQEIKSYEEQKRLADEREREARRRESEERRQQREIERVSEMAQDLGLNEQQSQDLLTARTGLRTTIREVFDYMREQGQFDRDTVRETMTELQQEHQKILAGFMNAEQLEKYEKKYSFNIGGRGRNR